MNQPTPVLVYPEPDTGSAIVDLSYVEALLDVIIETNDELAHMAAPEATQRLSDRCMKLGLLAHDLVRRAQGDLNPAPTAIIATFARRGG